MDEKQIRRALNAKAAAEADLVAADEQAAKSQLTEGAAGISQKKLARKMRRAAKRRMSKADRRQGRRICDAWQDEIH